MAAIEIEVSFALPDQQSLIALQVAEGTTVAEAIAQSQLAESYPEYDFSSLSVGVWNRVCKSDQILKQGDRVEIYRPLIADPKEVRKQRAERAKQEGRADKVTGGRPSTLRKAD